MRIKVKQHVYTSVKIEFETVFIDEEVSREEQLTLENNSNYFLPPEWYHSEEEKVYPVKYLLYPLSAKHYCIGRGVYKGVDSMGRVGNYLFHNYLIETEKLEQAGFHPWEIWQSLVDQSSFLEDADSSTSAVELSAEKKGLRTFDSLTAAEQNGVLRLVLAFSAGLAERSLIVGDDTSRLRAMRSVSQELPIHLRRVLSFDSYAYGQGSQANILGIPLEQEFQGSYSENLYWNMESGEIRENSLPPWFPSATDFLAAKNKAERDSFFLLILAMRERERMTLEEKVADIYLNSPENVQKWFAENRLGEVLTESVRGKRFEIVETLQIELTSEHWQKLLEMPGFVQRAIEKQYSFLPILVQKISASGKHHLIAQDQSLFSLFMQQWQEKAESPDYTATAFYLLKNSVEKMNTLTETDVARLAEIYLLHDRPQARIKEIAKILPRYSSARLAFWEGYALLLSKADKKKVPATLFRTPLIKNDAALNILLQVLCRGKEKDILQQIHTHREWFTDLIAKVPEGREKNRCVGLYEQNWKPSSFFHRILRK